MQDFKTGDRIKTLTGRVGTISHCPANSDMSQHYYFVRLDKNGDGNSLDRWVRKTTVTAIGNGGAS